MTTSTPANPQKSLEITLLESIQHIVKQHPGLAGPLHQLVGQHLGMVTRDRELLHALNQALLAKSKSQIRQDVFVLHTLGFKRQGYFVEFGATNGIDLSNTYLLEQEFGWKGIVAEPAPIWHEALRRNRRCHIETQCVWRTTGETLEFNEVAAPELSTIHQFSDCDGHTQHRKQGKTYDVKTISLNDLLLKYDAPRQIDYLSIDTEGSEYEILSHFDFGRWDIRVITCEHNYTPMREHLHTLLTRHGYVRQYEAYSLFDDWYVR